MVRNQSLRALERELKQVQRGAQRCFYLLLLSALVLGGVAVQCFFFPPISDLSLVLVVISIVGFIYGFVSGDAYIDKRRKLEWEVRNQKRWGSYR